MYNMDRNDYYKQRVEQINKSADLLKAQIEYLQAQHAALEQTIELYEYDDASALAWFAGQCHGAFVNFEERCIAFNKDNFTLPNIDEPFAINGCDLEFKGHKIASIAYLSVERTNEYINGGLMTGAKPFIVNN